MRRPFYVFFKCLIFLAFSLLAKIKKIMARSENNAAVQRMDTTYKNLRKKVNPHSQKNKRIKKLRRN